MRIVSAAVTGIPLARAYSPTAATSAATPRVRMYWKALALSRAMISRTTSWNASTGNVSGLGWPGANEITPGRSMSALIRRIAEKRMPRAPAEKRRSREVMWMERSIADDAAPWERQAVPAR